MTGLFFLNFSLCSAVMHQLFLPFSEGVNRGFSGFSSTFLMPCVWRCHVQKQCTVCEWMACFEKSHNATMKHCKPLSYQYSRVFLSHFHMKVIQAVFLVKVRQLYGNTVINTKSLGLEQIFARCAKPVKQESITLIDIKDTINRIKINEGLFL